MIAIENLKLKNMTASAKGEASKPGRNVAAKAGLNRALLAKGHFDFRRMLAYKCERSGARSAVTAHLKTARAKRSFGASPAGINKTRITMPR